MTKTSLIKLPPKIPIIDAHCHLWDLANGFYGWLANNNSELLGDLSPINKNYLITNYLADIQGYNFSGFVHIEAVSTQYARDEVRWLINEMANKTKIKNFGIVAGIDLNQDDVEALLADYGSLSLVKGVRQILSWHQNNKYAYCDSDYLTNAKWLKNYDLLKKYNLSFDMQINPQQLLAATKLAEKDIPIIINHAGTPIAAELEYWRKGITKLAQYPQVTVKISGFGMLDHHWSSSSIKPMILHIIENFGIERCMFASNFPVDKLYSSFTKLADSYYTVISNFNESEVQQFFAKNAQRIYRLNHN